MKMKFAPVGLLALFLLSSWHNVSLANTVSRCADAVRSVVVVETPAKPKIAVKIEFDTNVPSKLKQALKTYIGSEPFASMTAFFGPLSNLSAFSTEQAPGQLKLRITNTLPKSKNESSSPFAVTPELSLAVIFPTIDYTIHLPAPAERMDDATLIANFRASYAYLFGLQLYAFRARTQACLFLANDDVSKTYGAHFTLPDYKFVSSQQNRWVGWRDAAPFFLPLKYTAFQRKVLESPAHTFATAFMRANVREFSAAAAAPNSPFPLTQAFLEELLASERYLQFGDMSTVVDTLIYPSIGYIRDAPDHSAFTDETAKKLDRIFEEQLKTDFPFEESDSPNK